MKDFDRGKDWEWLRDILVLEDKGSCKKFDLNFCDETIWATISSGMTQVGFLVTKKQAKVIMKYLKEWLKEQNDKDN